MTGLLKGIGFAGKLAGIAAVVIAPIIDGILGYFNAEEWGVSKLGGIIGGIMGGGEGGALNALFNGMKWAAIGATAGSLIFPGIGTIIGGIGGALIGAILGWIGGDKIAKAVDGIGKWFEEKWNGFLNIFGLGKKESKETKLKNVQEDKKEIDTELAALEAKKKKQGGKLRGQDKFRHRQLTAMSENKAQRERNLEATGFDMTDAEKAKRIKELSYTLEESTGFGSGFKFGIAEAEDELKEDEEKYQRQLEWLASSNLNDAAKQRMKAGLDKGIAKEREKVQAMKNELQALQGNPPQAKYGMGFETEGLVWVHPREEVIEAGEVARIERALAGQTLNAQMLARTGSGGPAGMGSAPVIMDNSTVVQNNHNTTIPNPIGQMLPGEGDDFVRKVA
jgi:hypothetical protein